MNLKICAAISIVSLSLAACKDNSSASDGTDQLGSEALATIDSPEWAAHAVWYQIFPERFYNGDPSNDPRASDIAGSYPGFVPEGWQTTPWTQQWYQPDQYFAGNAEREDFYGNPVGSFAQQSAWRRYGGDLAGVLQKLDYLEDLGVTAIYFNPLNDAPSLHKYDAANWRHIDRNFGPNPDGDIETMAQEVPNEPSTWQWTEADQQFLQLVDELHARNIKVVMDYSWNHTGLNFWAWQDVVKKQQASEFADWYWVTHWDDPETSENEFDYHGWLGVHSLPEIRELEYIDHRNGTEAYDGDIFSEAVKQHIFNVTARWLDPNGDGDPSDGVDGFRLDVAAELPLTFWREYRSFVRSINPEAYLIGEVWWQQWPDKLLDPRPYLEGDVFDAHMNYRWYRAARHIFADAPERISITDGVRSLNMTHEGIPNSTYATFMNMSASHDSPRLSTSMFNRGMYKLDTSPAPDRDYRIDRPDAETWRNVDLLLLHQFTYLGAPQIWAGDEMGMWGSDDPHTRKPLIWPEFEFEPETLHPFGFERPANEVRFDEARHNLYRELIALRNSMEVLRIGEIVHVLQDDEHRVWGYQRFIETSEEMALVLFNLSEQQQLVSLPSGCELDQSLLSVGDVRVSGDESNVMMDPRSGVVLSVRCA